MLLGEPPPTQADLHFRLFGFPIRVHPFFWIATLLLGMGGREAEPVTTVIWVAVVFVSILVHELGHAVLQRYYGGHPWITLYSFGGLASCKDCNRSPKAQILISLAGPVAGFMFATALAALMGLAGRGIHFIVVHASTEQLLEFLHSSRSVPLELIGPLYATFKRFDSPWLTVAVFDLLYVNIFWGVLNLLPIYPLDGGHIARELFTLGNPRSGIVQSLQLSAGAAVLVAVYALARQEFYLALMFGLLAYGSFQTLQRYRGSWR